MKDLNGTLIKKGDILIECKGIGTNSKCEKSYNFQVFEFLDEPNTTGLAFNENGSRFRYSHCDARKSFVLDGRFQFIIDSFKKGKTWFSFRSDEIEFPYKKL